MNMWRQKQKADKENRRGRREQTDRNPKQALTALEKAKREYDLWVLAEEYEEEDR